MKLKHSRDVGLARSLAYPPVEEQLDMLWHGMDQGTIPKVEPFYSTIKEVKDAHPKKVEPS